MSDRSSTAYVALPNSTRRPIVGARKAGALDPNERVDVSIYLRPKADSKLAEMVTGADSARFQPLTREALAAMHGADPADVALVEDFAREHQLSIALTDLARRVVVLSGTVATMSAAFRVTLQRFTHQSHAFRSRSGDVQVPSALAPVIAGVFGLDNRIQAQPHVQVMRAPAGTIAPLAQVAQTFTPPQVAKLYNFPSTSTGAGETIAIIELRDIDGGGYRTVDLKSYFTSLGIKRPRVTSVSVDGGHNAPTGDPSDPHSADVEVVLDIEVAGSVAPGAHIVVYFAPNTDQGFIDAISTAVHDTKHKPSVISISWGGPEVAWTAQAMQQMDQAFQAAAALGVTVCCAAGDHGAQDAVGDGKAHADFPASSPFALACGGTRLATSGATIISETVWNNHDGWAGGGGISDVFPLPTWQAGASVPPSINPDHHVGRGLPDVAGDADGQTGYQVHVDGQTFPVGGTSAVAPLYAGLVALLNQQLSRPVGYLNPLLYQNPAVQAAFRDITGGDNATGNDPGYAAGAQWDACTGWGVADGMKLLAALQTALGVKAAATVGATVAEQQP